MTLACEDANSKLVDVVTVADGDRVGNNLLQIRKLRFVQKAKLLFRLWAQGLVKFLSWSSDKIWSWSLISFFCWCFVEVMLNPIWILVEILKLGLVKILKLKFYGEADDWLRFWSWCLFEILKMTFDQDLCLNLLWAIRLLWYKLNSTLGSVVPLAMF